MADRVLPGRERLSRASRVDHATQPRHATIEQHLALPFETVVLGVAVTVKAVDVAESGHIVAICHRGRERQAIPILELPLPDPLPSGWEWIEAYRRWAKGR